MPFDDTKVFGRFASFSLVMLGDGGHLLPSSWGRDGVEFVALFIRYIRVFVLWAAEDETHGGRSRRVLFTHVRRNVHGFFKMVSLTA